jgi:hypothetical protein
MAWLELSSLPFKLHIGLPGVRQECRRLLDNSNMAKVISAISVNAKGRPIPKYVNPMWYGRRNVAIFYKVHMCMQSCYVYAII